MKLDFGCEVFGNIPICKKTDKNSYKNYMQEFI
jgi:hypothetical protein